MFKNWTVGRRITVGFATVLLLLAAVSSVGYWALQKASDGFAEYRTLARGANAMGLVQARMFDRRLMVKEFIATGDQSIRDRFDESYKVMMDEIGESREALTKAEHLAVLDEMSKRISEYQKGFDALATARNEADTAQKSILNVRGPQAAEALQSIISSAKTENDITALFYASNALQALMQVRLAVFKFISATQHSKQLEGVIRAEQEKFGVALATLDQALQKPVHRSALKGAQDAAKEYSAGIDTVVKGYEGADEVIAETLNRIGPTVAKAVDDTKLAIKNTQDELGPRLVAADKRAISIMIAIGCMALVLGVFLAVIISRAITKTLANVITGLSASSEQVTAAATQVAGASQQLAEGASEQASSLEETSASLEQMSSMTKQNAENANQASFMAEDTRAAAEQGRTAMSRMSDAINKIKASSDETAKILKTIDEIAFQTNLLALNAAVEAARAGDAGKGFAVVAEEVRNLAQRSAQAAKTTAELIEGSRHNSDNGVAVSTEVATILEKIADRVGKMTRLVAEVSAASSQQSVGIDQINTAVSQMDQITQSNAANAEESASASEELSAQALELNQFVKVLAEIVGGANDNHTAHVHALPTRRTDQRSLPATRRSYRNGQNELPPRNGGVRAVAPSTPQKKLAKPEEVIPLDEEDLSDF